MYGRAVPGPCRHDLDLGAGRRGFIEHPMGFVDVEVRHGISDVWPRGTILADAYSSTPIGAVGL